MATLFHLKPLPNGSSNIMGWDFNLDCTTNPDTGEEGGTLTLQFKYGATYQYSKVPESQVKEFLEAESHGKYFIAHIKDKYETIKI